MQKLRSGFAWGSCLQQRKGERGKPVSTYFNRALQDVTFFSWLPGCLRRAFVLLPLVALSSSDQAPPQNLKNQGLCRDSANGRCLERSPTRGLPFWTHRDEISLQEATKLWKLVYAQTRSSPQARKSPETKTLSPLIFLNCWRLISNSKPSFE